jgi:glycosyltransferase involved in cell wall biosynthesis
MSSTPLVSVGLFVHNGERFIQETLNSILNQTFTDFELIISDNASTDGTGEIAQAYAKSDDRIRYYRSEKNMGPGWNARRVYELATGKYFECDPGCVVAYARTKEVDENGTFIKNYVTPLTLAKWMTVSFQDGGYMKVDSNDPVARFRAMLLPLHMCYQIYGVMRMSALHQIPPQGVYVNADGVLLARMSLLGRFYEVPEHLFISRHHSGQSVQTLPVRLTEPRRFRLTNRFGILPCSEWWNPAKARALTFPEFRQLLEFFLSIYRAPLSAGQKLRCYSMLLLWIDMHFMRMLKDLLIAADQVLYNLQVAKATSTDFKQKVGPRERKLP